MSAQLAIEKQHKALVVELRNAIPATGPKAVASVDDSGSASKASKQDTFVTAPKTEEITVEQTTEKESTVEVPNLNEEEQHQLYTIKDPPEVIMEGMTVVQFTKIVKSLRE